MEHYRALGIFVAVVDAGSFSAAGRRLKLSTSVVSHHISRLEAKLGVALLFRSTRSLSLTGEGQQVLDAARRMVAAGEQALDALSEHSDQPTGKLRVTLPAFGSNSWVHQAVWAFAKLYPGVSLFLHSSDQPVDLVREGYDVAIRLGRLADSALKSRRIGTLYRWLVAAPDYLKDIPPIAGPADLAKCDFVSVSGLQGTMTLSRGAENVTVSPRVAQLEVDSVTAAKAAVLSGLGIMRLPLNEVAAQIDAGTLVHVLPDWQLPTLGVHVIWPDTGPQRKLTRRFIDFLVERQGPL